MFWGSKCSKNTVCWAIHWRRELLKSLCNYFIIQQAHCRWRYSTGKPDIGFECYCWIVVVMETAGAESAGKSAAATWRWILQRLHHKMDLVPISFRFIVNLNYSARLNCLKSWEQAKRMTKSMYLTQKIRQKFDGKSGSFPCWKNQGIRTSRSEK